MNKDDHPQNSEEAWKRMLKGNTRFYEKEGSNYVAHFAQKFYEMKTNLLNIQKAYAIVITCSDSRVSPEIIFNEGLGDLYVIRLAGNIVDDNVMASIEFAV